MQQQATMTTSLWGYVTGAGVWERYMGNLICNCEGSGGRKTC